MGRKKQALDFISSETYRQRLVARGFSEIQANRLLLKSPVEVLNILVNAKSDEWQRMLQLISHENLLSVCEKSGGLENLTALVETAQFFIDQGFTTHQVIMMVQYKDGYKNLQSVIEHYSELVQMGMQQHQIVPLAANVKGHEIIAGFIAFAPMLLTLGYALDQLVIVASNRTGVANLIGLTTWHDRLLSLGFTREQLAIATSYNEGDVNIRALYNALSEFRSLPFTHEEWLRLVCWPNGHHNLNALHQCREFIESERMSTADICKIVGRQRGNEFLFLLQRRNADIKSFGFTTEQLVCLIEILKFVKPLDVLLDAMPLMQSFSFDAEDVVDTFRCGASIQNYVTFDSEKGFFYEIKPPKALLKLLLTGRQSIAGYIKNFRAGSALTEFVSPDSARVLYSSLAQDAAGSLNQPSGLLEPNALPQGYVLTPESELLLNMGFTTQQLMRLQCSQNFTGLVGYLRTELTNPFSAIVHYFDNEQITQAATKRAWRRCLDSMAKFTANLVQKGFTITEILRLLDGDGPDRNFFLVTNHFELLANHYHLTPAQMTEALSAKGGADHYNELVLAAQQSMQPVTSPALLRSTPTLIQELNNFGFTMDEASNLCKRKLGTKLAADLINLLNEDNYLLSVFRPHELIALSCDFGYVDNLKMLRQCVDQLLSIGFNRAQLISITAFQSGAKNLEVIIEQFDVLISRFKLVIADIYMLARHEGGGRNIYAFIYFFDQLSSQGFYKEQVLAIAANQGGFTLLERVHQNLLRMAENGLSPADVTTLVVRCKNVYKLEAYFAYFSLLKPYGFTLDYFIKILSNQNYKEVIVLIYQYRSVLAQRYMTAHKITAFVTIRRSLPEIEEFLQAKFFQAQESPVNAEQMVRLGLFLNDASIQERSSSATEAETVSSESFEKGW